MHYVIFLGIFGLPFVAAVGMVITKVLGAFASVRGTVGTKGDPQGRPSGLGLPCE